MAKKKEKPPVVDIDWVEARKEIEKLVKRVKTDPTLDWVNSTTENAVDHEIKIVDTTLHLFSQMSKAKALRILQYCVNYITDEEEG